jgi:uncharacterized protein YecE (DUF72 family)
MSRILIGTSGWHYDSWRGRFFPPGLPLKSRLQYYTSQFPTAELNGVFYRTPTPEAVQSWHEQSGKEFVFAWKASKFITHWKRLADSAQNSLELLEDRMSRLGGKAGPILFQLPPNFKANPDRLAAFLKLLSRKLVHSANPQVTHRIQHLALPLRPSRCPGALEAYRGLCLCQGARTRRTLQGPLSRRPPSRMGKADPILEEAGVRRLRLFR